MRMRNALFGSFLLSMIIALVGIRLYGEVAGQKPRTTPLIMACKEPPPCDPIAPTDP